MREDSCLWQEMRLLQYRLRDFLLHNTNRFICLLKKKQSSSPFPGNSAGFVCSSEFYFISSHLVVSCFQSINSQRMALLDSFHERSSQCNHFATKISTTKEAAYLNCLMDFPWGYFSALYFYIIARNFFIAMR